MIQFKLEDGSYMNVTPENLDVFKQRYPNAVEVGKTNGSAGVTPIGGPSGMGSSSVDGSLGQYVPYSPTTISSSSKQQIDEKERDALDIVKSWGASLGRGVTSIADNFTKLYETGEGGFLGEVVFENPFVASYGYAAEYLRSKGYDIPDEMLGMDLTTPNQRREMYETHMLNARDEGLTLEEAQKLDPTNTVKFEKTLEWFDKVFSNLTVLVGSN